MFDNEEIVNFDKNEHILAQTEVVLPTTLPVIHLNNTPVFPGLVAPIVLPVGQLVKAIEIAMTQGSHVALLMTRSNHKNPTVRDLYSVGVVAKILKKINLPDGGTSVLLQGVKKFKVVKFVKNKPFLIAKVEYLDDVFKKDTELDALVRTIRTMIKSLAQSNPLFTEELRLAMINVPSVGMMADLIMFTLGVDPILAQEYLENIEVKERLKLLLTYLKKEEEVSQIQARITKEVNDKISSLQREYFLKEQLKVIKKELGMEQDEKSHDINKLKIKLKKSGISEEGKKIVLEELDKLNMIPESSPEYSVSRNYVDWLVSLPWDINSKDEININKASSILNKSHYGLEKVKNRILEYLAVRLLNPKYEGNILLFLGPPGVGKTSLGMAIAEAMGRKFYRFSLGGMRDEAEIKGHRRTYIGSMPGKIMQGIKRVETKNPVMMLDEVDKLGISYQGDPSAALLEVLDSEQNFSFVDHYLDIGFDLSQVLFICTANDVSSIPPALLDRMEVIEFPGYILEEKIKIATNYLIPKLLKRHGLNKKYFKLDKKILATIIDKYARDPGARFLEKALSKLMRKVAMSIAKKDKIIKNFKISDIEKYLGPEVFKNETYRRVTEPGVVVGLAWTAYGGDILFIESSAISNDKPQFKYTGQLGDVMKESALISYTYAKKWISLNSKNSFFNENDIHLHIPAGAIPKDGPSAGITMCMSLISLAYNKKLPVDLAMTGELSIVGKVLPVGGIKEKLIAAVRSGIKKVIIPSENEKDIKEVPDNIKNKLKLYYVKEMKDVIKICFKN